MTIGLGLYLVNRSNPPSPEQAPASRAVVPARVQRSDGPAAIAVLPLQNLSGDPKQDYFADGMTEALIAQLAQVKGLRVISRTSSMQYKGQAKPIPQIAQELGVGLIVEGSVTRSGDRIRITAQLIDAARDEHIWARSYDRTSRDVLALEADVAGAIVGEIQGAAAAQRRAASAQARRSRGLRSCTCAAAMPGTTALRKATPKRFATSNRQSNWIRRSRSRTRAWRTPISLAGRRSIRTRWPERARRRNGHWNWTRTSPRRMRRSAGCCTAGRTILREPSGSSAGRSS